MSSVMRSEATAGWAGSVKPEPERKSAQPTRGMPARVLRMQQAAGNHAVAQAIARTPARAAIQRCGANCSCNSCSGKHDGEEELLEEQLGAGLLRSAVANRA